jgi:hypothetical protein
MANVLILDPTLSDAATATGLGTLASAMPAHNVLNLAPGSRARWTATSGAGIKLDLGASASWDIVALIGHNADAAGTYRIRADADEADVDGDSATLDVNGRSFWPASGKPSGRDIYHSFYRHSSTLTLRWVRIDFSIASTPFDLRRIMIGKAFQPTCNFEYGSGDGYIPTGGVERSIGGHTWGLYGRPLNIKSLQLIARSHAELYGALHKLLRDRSAERDLFICLDEDQDAYLADMMLWGHIENPGIPAIQAHDFWRYSLNFVEQAP